MGVEPFLIASTVRIVIAQRLVRRLCVDCRVPYEPDATTVKQLVKSFRVDDHGGLKRMHELEEVALNDGIGKSSTAKAETETDHLGSTPTNFTRLWKAADKGCDRCNHTGYKGRIGIYEVLTNSTKIQGMIVGSNTSESIEKAAVEEGMLSMQLDGLIKALRGQTTIEEILRVTAQE
jgi:type IV pilus assembly protein PilB